MRFEEPEKMGREEKGGQLCHKARHTLEEKKEEEEKERGVE